MKKKNPFRGQLAGKHGDREAEEKKSKKTKIKPEVCSRVFCFWAQAKPLRKKAKRKPSEGRTWFKKKGKFPKKGSQKKGKKKKIPSDEA